MEIVLEDVSYRYNHSNLLEHLDLTLKGPKIIGIMGPHKTLLLELIGAINPATRGKISVGNQTITDTSMIEIRKSISLVHQDSNKQFLYANLEEEVLSRSTFIGKSKEYLESRMIQALQIVGLDETYRNRPYQELSQGETKLVQIAFSLIQNAKVILFDEVLKELDYVNKKRILRLIKMLREKYNKTVIIASNDSNILYPLVEEIIVLDGKKVAFQGSVEGLFHMKNVAEKYHISTPDLVEFTNLAKKKKVKLSFHKDMRDLIKDVYKHV